MPPPLSVDALDLAPEAIAARFRWARERGHPAWLWPEISVVAWRAALDAIERVATELLTDPRAEARLALPSTGSEAVRALGVAAYTSGLGPLLGYWIETDRLAADADAAALLHVHLVHGRGRAERFRRELRRTLDVLAAAEIHAVVLKGAHTAYSHFPEPGLRPAADIDLAVEPRQVDGAERALAAAGYAITRRQPWLRRSDWVPPGAPTRLRSLEVIHADDPYTIDLHASLDRDFFGIRTVRPGTADEESTNPWPSFHPAARVLRQPLLAAFLAIHASEGLHNLTLLRLTELVLVLRKDSAAGRLRWDDLTGLLEDAGALRFACPALILAERLAPGTVAPGLLSAVADAAPPRMARLLATLRPAGAQRVDRLSLGERFLWASGPIEHLRRAVHMIWPTSIRGSFGKVRHIYGERLYRLLRGRVAWS
ncbi:MAG TPA: nucleotidyltransferase family protein [Longimicrobiales bacterium]